jgi:hypothetical protein
MRKVYEADSLGCPKCNWSIRVMALIDDPGVVHRSFNVIMPLSKQGG